MRLYSYIVIGIVLFILSVAPNLTYGSLLDEIDSSVSLEDINLPSTELEAIELLEQLVKGE